jgi:PTS system mannose-specific IIC component
MIEELFVDSVAVAFIGALLSLDRSAVIQSMLSRPLASASVIGLFLGEPAIGLAAGVILEFLYMGDLPVGSYMPAHEMGLSVVVTAVSVAFVKAASPEVFSFGSVLFGTDGPLRVVLPVLLISIPVAFLFKRADIYTRKINERLFLNASRSLDDNEDGAAHPTVVKENLKGILNFFWPVAVMLFVTVFMLSLIVQVFARSLESADISVLGPVVVAGVLLAVAMALRAVKTSGSLVVFSVSGVAAAVVWTFVR